MATRDLPAALEKLLLSKRLSATLVGGKMEEPRHPSWTTRFWVAFIVSAAVMMTWTPLCPTGNLQPTLHSTVLRTMRMVRQDTGGLRPHRMLRARVQQIARSQLQKDAPRDGLKQHMPLFLIGQTGLPHLHGKCGTIVGHLTFDPHLFAVCQPCR